MARKRKTTAVRIVKKPRTMAQKAKSASTRRHNIITGKKRKSK